MVCSQNNCCITQVTKGKENIQTSTFMLLILILLRIKEARDSVTGWLKRWLADQFDSR